MILPSPSAPTSSPQRTPRSTARRVPGKTGAFSRTRATASRTSLLKGRTSLARTFQAPRRTFEHDSREADGPLRRAFCLSTHELPTDQERELEGGRAELAHRRLGERDVRRDRSEPHVLGHRNRHHRGLKPGGVASPRPSGSDCGPGNGATDPSSSGSRKSTDVVDARCVSAANCDRGADRLSIEPSDEQPNLRVGRDAGEINRCASSARSPLSSRTPMNSSRLASKIETTLTPASGAGTSGIGCRTIPG